MSTPAAASDGPVPALIGTCRLPTGATHGWPVATAGDPVFGAAGIVFTVLRRDYWEEPSYAIVALDAHGRVRPGWPICLPEPGAEVGLAAGDDGSVFATICQPEVGGCRLDHFTLAAEEPPGWPLPLAGMTHCAAPLVGPDGTVYASCEARSSDHHLLAGLTVAVDQASGANRPGWPVRIGGELERAIDGTLYVSERDWYREESSVTVTALAPDGRVRRGWPLSLPVAAEARLAPDGTLVAWWYENLQGGEGGYTADRTFYSLLGIDGRTLPGWPRSADQAASSPAIGPDGTLYYDSIEGDVYALDRGGAAKRGWPVYGIGGEGLAVSPPFVGPDGTVFALDSSGVTALGSDGPRLWSWGAGRSNSLSRCFGATPCAERVDDPPALGPDGNVFALVYRLDEHGRSRARIFALDRRGDVMPGWPQDAPLVYAALALGPDRLLYVAGPDGLDARRLDGSRVR